LHRCRPSLEKVDGLSFLSSEAAQQRIIIIIIIIIIIMVLNITLCREIALLLTTW